MTSGALRHRRVLPPLPADDHDAAALRRRRPPPADRGRPGDRVSLLRPRAATARAPTRRAQVGGCAGTRPRRARPGRLTLDDVLTRQRVRVEAERAEQDRRLAAPRRAGSGAGRRIAIEEVVLRRGPPPRAAGAATWEGAEQATRHALARLLVRCAGGASNRDHRSGALFPVDPEPELTVVAYTGVDTASRPRHRRAAVRLWPAHHPHRQPRPAPLRVPDAARRRVLPRPRPQDGAGGVPGRAGAGPPRTELSVLVAPQPRDLVADNRTEDRERGSGRSG